MLVCQGARALSMWTGQLVSADVMRAALLAARGETKP
jgi:shikimate 5-dehydrogenase